MESRANRQDLSRGLLAFLLSACFLAAVAIAWQVVEGYMTGPRVSPAAATPESDRSTPLREGDPWVPSRLFVFVVDGLPEGAAFDPRLLPWANSLRERGAWGVSMAPLVTMTTSCVRTIGTGYAPPLMDVVRAFDAPLVHEDHLFRQLQRARYFTWFAGDASWTQLFGLWCKESLAVRDQGIFDTSESDEEAERFARSRFRPWPRVVMLAHFVGSDHVAHRTGTSGPEYEAKLREIDDRMRRICADWRVGADDLVLVLADHGATAAGNHGGGEEVARRAPFIIVGPAIRPGGPFTTDHRAWAATIAYLLRVPIPKRAERGPAWEFLDASPEERVSWETRTLDNRRETLIEMGASREECASAFTHQDLDAIRDRVSRARPTDVSFASFAAGALLGLLVTVGAVPRTAGTAGGAWLLALVLLVAAAAVLLTGQWRHGLVAGVLAAGGLALRVPGERPSWTLRAGAPWVLGVLVFALASWAVANGWRAVKDGEVGGTVLPVLSVLALGAPVAVSPARIGRLARDGGLGLGLFAVAASIPAVWCYWWPHRAIYAVIATLALVAVAWSRGPRALRPFVPLAAMLAWALAVVEAERVPREANHAWTAALGAVLCLPVLLGLRGSPGSLASVVVFLGVGQLHRFTGHEELADLALVAGLPIAVAACLLATDLASRRRALLIWGLGLCRVLAKDHQFVTLALYAWLVDELAERLVARPVHLAVVVGAMVAFDLLQFHLLGSVYTFSTIDVTTGFVGTAQGLNVPRSAALVFLRYAVPLLFLALLAPPPVRGRALASFALCLLSRCVYLLLLFPWKRADFWWISSAAPGVIFTAFQIGLWHLVAIAAILTVPRAARA